MGLLKAIEKFDTKRNVDFIALCLIVDKSQNLDVCKKETRQTG